MDPLFKSNETFDFLVKIAHLIAFDFNLVKIKNQNSFARHEILTRRGFPL